MKKIMKKGKVEGSILFTVVLVMMVMVVFLMATLGLTSSANRRSYYTYFETQAQYAAQAALDAVTNSAYTDGEFYDWVQKASKAYAADPSTDKQKPQVTVNFDGSNIQFTNRVKSVTCEVELADESLVWDELTGAVHKTPAYKITATASVGNGKNRSDYTVVNYIYENYRIDDPEKLPSVSNNANNKLFNWTRKNGGESHKNLTPNVPKAVYSFGMNSAGNNVQYFGPQYNNMSVIPVGRVLYNDVADNDEKFAINIANNNVSVGNSVYVGNLISAVESTYVFQDYKEYSIIYGNMYPGQPDPGIRYYANISEDSKDLMRGQGYSNMPYIYVDGIVDTKNNNGSLVIGYDEQWNPSNENINLYCGGIRIGVGDNTGSLMVRGDVFLYDPDVKSVWGGGVANDKTGKTRLATFTANNLSGLNVKWGMDTIGGNIYCNNMQLDLNAPLDIPGDLVFTNKAGTLNINTDITVHGKVLCAGKINGLDKLTCDTIVTPVTTKVAGIDYNNLENVTDEKLQKYIGDANEDGVNEFNNTAFLYDTYGDKSFYGVYLNTQGSDTYDATSETATANWDSYQNQAYQQALMPYNMRLDEIFGTYYRWDMKGTDEEKVWERIRDDALIKESQATGHTYQVKAFDCGSYVSQMENPEDWDPQTLYNDDANAFMQQPHDDVTIIEDYQGTWIPTPDAPGGGYWKKVVYNAKTIRYKDPVWVEDIMYVPYTTSRCGGDFIPTYTPYTNEREIATAVGESLITDISAFSMPDGAPRYVCDKGKANYIGDSKLIRADVPIGYHNPDKVNKALDNNPVNQGWDTATTLEDAYVIKESCYIDLAQSVTYGDNKFLIDPTGHDASDPIRIVLSGAGQLCGIFVVNNTAHYATNYESIVASYAERGEIAPKGAVQIFLQDGFYATNLLQLYNSGLYPLATSGGVSYGSASGAFTVVSNPVYPKNDKGEEIAEFASVPEKLRYCYEYVPLTMVYGKAGATYGGQNGWILNANVSIPKSTYHADNGTLYKANVTYQEYYYSAPYSRAEFPCFGIGTIVCGDMHVEGGEATSVVYIGDENNEGSEIIEDDGKTENKQYSGKIGNENTEYFSNDHIGAS